MKIELKILNKEFYEEFELPSCATEGSSAVDLYSTEDCILHVGEVGKIPTGLAIYIGGACHSHTFYKTTGLLLPRSSWGTKGLVLANTIGVIDPDYQGELIISAWNRLKNNYIKISRGDRIAQLMIVPYIIPEWKIVEEFTNKTERNNGSFGSTGD